MSPGAVVLGALIGLLLTVLWMAHTIFVSVVSLMTAVSSAF